MSFDYLIVGSGLFGATIAYKARQAGKTCLVIDKRPHLGGNVYCEPVAVADADGKGEHVINVHKYGAHIFHTSNKEVWDFVNGIVEFNRYTNCPVANYKGELYNLPFNMNTFNKMWPDVHTPAEAMARIEEQRAPFNGAHAPVPQNLEEQAISLVGRDIYTKLIKDYTEKQWGRDCKDLPAFIIKRLPVRLIFDNNYFNDRYQGIPIGGYNKLIDGLLEGTECMTGIDFKDCERSFNSETGLWDVRCSSLNVQSSMFNLHLPFFLLPLFNLQSSIFNVRSSSTPALLTSISATGSASSTGAPSPLRPALRTHLSPAKVVFVIADSDEKSAKVVVPDDQLSLAIGKEGQNARLAAKLTGFKIDIKSETQAQDTPGFRLEDYYDEDEEYDEYEDGEYYEEGEYAEGEYSEEEYADDAVDEESAEPDKEEE